MKETWEEYLARIKATGAEVVEADHTTFIQLPKTIEGLRDLMLILLEKPTPDEAWLADCVGLEPGNTLRVWWD